MNILILGGGGREHALAWAFAQNPKCDRLWCAPGNAGIAEEATCVALDILDGDKVLGFCRENAVDFVMVGPEAPLAEGVADVLREGGVATFGPGREAARLEASKAFTKEVCAACGAPTAASQTFTDEAAARAYVEVEGAPIVVKADGLAAGKGVTVAGTVAEALTALDAVFREGPGARVVIEAFMAGEEASLFVLADGEEVRLLGTAQDHKRAFDGDEGPNTGGMGAYSPAPVMTEAVTEAALERIVRPTLREMARRGAPYQGVLYAGLMIEDGAPRLVEYNVRFGDPEVQVLAMRLGAQLLDACHACATGGLAAARVNFAADHAVTVVMAAKGYPGDYARGERIGLTESDDPRVKVFHAGTRMADGALVSDGGRVLNATARAASLREARDLAYGALAAVDWPGGFFRRDIGWRALGAPRRWETVPPPAPMPEPVARGMAAVNGFEMYHAVYGSGTPVLLIHGGMNHADIWGGVVAELMRTRQVIVADSRGHGRSTRGEAPLGYGQLAADHLALLDHLGVGRTAVVGWSDGAIIGLELAMRHPERVSRLFADAANATPDGLDLAGMAAPTFAAFAPTVEADYRRLSPAPEAWRPFSREVVAMWKREPDFSAEALASIRVPTAVAGGDHDEIVRPEHAAYLARTIPGARRVVIEETSHFALLQDPAGYARAVAGFLDAG